MSEYDNPRGRHIIPLKEISEAQLERSYRLPGTDLEEVAQRLKIPAIEHLDAAFAMQRASALIVVTGHINARLERICVASLEQMQEEIDTDFALEFLPVKSERAVTDEELVSDGDEPEPLYDSYLDLRELAIQQLALEMAPYPRKPGATPLKDMATQPELSPFAVLKGGKTSDNRDN